MTSPPGWYPDPGGRAGHFRYWDGRNWSAATTTNPAAAPPATVPGQPSSSAPGPAAPTPVPGAPRRRTGLGWVLGLVAIGVLVIVVIAVLVVRGTDTADPGTGPVEQPSSDPCQAADAASPTAPPAAGERVTSGKLSVMRMPPPFQAPKPDSRVPFGHDVQSMDAPVETSADGRVSWVAGVLIARLLAGDGFYGPEQGAKLVVTCITGVFYGEAEVTRDDVKDEAIEVDGREAWLIESQLSFDVPGIRTKGELLIVAVVDTGDGEAGLFYASIPDTTPELVATAREALADLRVE